MTSLSLQPGSSLSDTVTLNDGVVMPLFGLGCYLSETGTDGSPAETAVTYALQHGYKMIDTAQSYDNEADVGRGIQKSSGIKREDIFIVSKVRNECHGYDLTIQTVEESLKKLDTPYIDLYLIHSPLEGKNIETYKALLDMKAKGFIRSVGVSNFGPHHLEGLRLAGLPAPSVNQIELHVFQRKSEIVDYCLKHGIFPMGYSPIAQAKKMDDPDLIRIAQRLDKKIAQVMIRWSVQRGFITIPKSTTQERILENSQVFDFKLSDDDMHILNTKPEHLICWNPAISPWEG